MSKLPRNESGLALAKRLEKFGYKIDRQKGSHIRLTRIAEKGKQHITIPAHSPLKIGTLNSILDETATQLGIDKRVLIEALFGG